ncbi:hypothetical protein TNCV_1228231 [Trichonephila clavipes]|nr:hypothetical protein TNCV_1228231 [Trichonephila clavipes]
MEVKERYLILCQEYECRSTRTELRILAFDFIEKLVVNIRFNKINQMTGGEWMYSFLKRLTVRKDENLSINRALEHLLIPAGVEPATLDFRSGLATSKPQDPTEPLHVKPVEAQMSSRLCDLEVRRGELPAQVSSSALEYKSIDRQ